MENGLESLITQEVEPKKDTSTLKAKKTVDNKKTTSNLGEGYTMSPDGKYKIAISEYDSDRLEENRFNIPQIKIPGWVVIWPHDVRANSLDTLVKKGWQFVSPNEPGCEAAGRKIPAGRTQGGETAFHYAMKMPESKYKELMKREEAERAAMEEAIKRAPSAESKAIYGTEQMHFSRDVLGAKMA